MTTDLYASSLARVMLEDAVVRDDTTSVEAARSRKVDAFAALLVSLFADLQSGRLDETEYLARVALAFEAAVGEVPEAVQATITRLRDQALARARSFVKAASLPNDHEDAPSDKQKTSWGQIVAGSLWAATIAAGVLSEEKTDIFEWESQDDPAVCDDCDELDGQQFSRDELPFWPGESDFGDSLPDGSQCGPNCRCMVRKVMSV